MIEERLAAVAAATVRLPRHGGQGVIVPGGYIVTAAHVVHWRGTGDQHLSPDDYREHVVFGSREFPAAVAAVEVVSDVAVLGEPDGQRDFEGWEAFAGAIEAVEPVRIGSPSLEPFTVHILAKTGDWVTGRANHRDGSHRMWVEASAQIHGGTSGGPIVNDEGLLLGVVSSFSEGNPVLRAGDVVCDGAVSLLPLVLPTWLLREILKPESEA